MFEEPHRGWGDSLEREYLHIKNTLNAILDRGDETEHYNAVEKTPLFVADIDRYLREIIHFAQHRMNPRASYNINAQTISPDWHRDQSTLIRMEEKVKQILTAITPPDTAVHAHISQAVHRAMES
jgi:hypothetical protein